MTFSEWSNKKKKEREEENQSSQSSSSSNSSNNTEKAPSSFSEWSNKKHGITEYEGIRIDSIQGQKGWQKYLDDRTSTEQQETKEETFWDKLGRWLGSTGATDTTLSMGNTPQIVHDLRADQSHRRPSKDWSESQRNEFGSLYLVSPELAYEYAEETNKRNNKAKEEAAIKEIQDKATANGWAGTAHTAGAIASTVTAGVDFLNDLTLMAAGREYAPDGVVTPFEYSQAVTEGIGTHLNDKYGVLDEDIPVIGGKGWGDVYGIGTSTLESVYLGLTGGLPARLFRSYASNLDDAKKRGATDGQAAIFALTSGTVEALLEQAGFEKLFNIKSASTWKQLFTNVFKQAGVEASEEGATSFINNIADNIIMMDKSNFNIMVSEYMKVGLSEEEAKEKAWKDSFEGILYDALAGGISGGLHAGAVTAGKTAWSNHVAKKTFGDGSGIVQEALDNYDEGSEVRDLAEKYNGKLEGGKSLSGGQINRLNNAIITNDQGKIRDAIVQRLSELGETSDTTAVADVLVGQAMGEELTSKDTRILNDSKAGYIVLAEMDKDNIKSGGLANKWAEKIGTRRINPDVYNREANAIAKKANATEAKREASKDAKITIEKDGAKVEVKPNKITSIENDTMSIELENGEVVNADEVDFGESGTGLVYQAAKDMAARVGGFNVDTANVFVRGYDAASGQSAGAYINGWISAYKFGTMKNPPPLSALAANPTTSKLTEEQRKMAYNFGRAFGNEKVATNKKSEGFEGEYTKRSYNSEQAELLSALPVEALQNAMDSNGALSFNAIGLGGDSATQQKWIDAGLTYTEDGKVYVDENAVLDERDRRRNALKETKKAETASETQKSTKKNGRVIFDGAAYGKRLNERQRASLKVLNFIAKALGKDIYVERLGKGDNGWYDPKDRSIHIDLYAGVEAEALMLFVAAHELTHDIRATLPDKFNTLADAIFEEYNKRYDEHTMADLIEAKIEFLKEQGDITEDMTEEEAYDLAFEEVICDCCETLLVDSDAITALSKNIYAKDKQLWQRIKDFFARLVARFRAAYADVIPDTEEGQRFRDLGEGAERIKNLWVESIVELSKVDKATGEGKVKHSYSSIAYSFFGDENISIKDMESKAYKKTEGYKQYVDQCLNNMRQSVEDFSERSALKEITDSIDGIVEVAVAMKKAGYDILDSEGGRNIRDSKKRLLFSSLEPNSDYFTSSDISTICDKRINFAEIYDEIVRREDAMGVPKSKRFFNNIDNYFVLHKILADKGLTAPCRQCYVESMRKNLDPMANAFIELMQETDPNNKANKQLYQPSGKNKGELKSNNAKLRENLLEVIEREQYDITADKLTIKMLTTADGLAQLKLQAPLIYEAFNSFYGQSKPKMPKAATPFRFGELTALLTDDKGKIKTGLIKQIMSTGGFRLQSYSDFQIQNFADVLQVIFEAGTLGLNGHAYTKVPAFLDATKGTNLKRNISIFMYKDGGQWKIDRGDSFPYELEGIYDIVDADESGNTGIIAVVQNEDMAAWIMANNNIGYFIPFHKSGVKMGVVRETVVREGGREIKGYSGIKDHTRQQTEVWAKTTADHKANTKVKKGINIYEFWDFDNAKNLSQKELIKKNVMAYIDACNEAGYLPKFREYVMDNGKVLNKVLAYAKELGFVSQNATIDDISFEYSGYRIPYGYYKCLGDFGMFTPDGEASPIERLSLKDYKFDEAVKFFSDAETLRRNEILQQFENGLEREKYRSGEYSYMTTAELSEEVQNRRNQVVDEVVSGEYKKKKYSHTVSEKSDYAAKITAEMTEEEIKSGEKVADFIDSVSMMLDQSKISKRRLKIGELSVSHRTTIEELMRTINPSFSAEGYELWIDGTGADHIVIRHGENGEADNTMASREDRELIPWATNSPDSGEFIRDESGNLKLSNRFFNTDGTKAPQIRLHKKLDGGTMYVSECVPDSKNKRIYITSAYKNGSTNQLLNIDSVESPQPTPEATFDSSATKSSISHPDDSVKSKFSHKADRKASYAPTFYSHMGNVIDAIKLEKMGAGGVVSYLKGKGVKDEEIKWSGIETFLEGKKSVTKAELQEFVAGSQLQIEETDSGINNEAYTELDNLWRENFLSSLEDVFDPEDFDETTVSAQLAFLEENGMEMPSEDIQQRMIVLAHKIGKPTRWEQYKLDGGENYRELVFKLPGSTYSNRAMKGHWGGDAEGILVHTRIQDFTVDGKKMLFIEELQSDWHNEGLQKGYTTPEYEETVAVYDKLADDYTKKRQAFNKYVRSSEFRSDPDEVSKKKFDWLRSKMDTAEKRMQDAERDIETLKKKGMGDVEDAPFKNNYHEYVLKRLLRMAAEEGYDSIGWTPSWIQSERWSEDYAEAYRIEYDQDIPKFLRKYGKKWGATVGKEAIGKETKTVAGHDLAYYKNKLAEYEQGLAEAETENDEWYYSDRIAEMKKLIADWSNLKSEGTEIWSMDITDSMKDSVLTEGQALYQHRATNGMKTRTLLANALETAAQNDIEREKLKQYKSKIDLINSEQEKLQKLQEQISELYRKKGKRDTEAIKKLQFEANQAANRINTYDKQLLNLESTKALKGVLEREKEMLRKRLEQKATQSRKEALDKARERAAKTQRELMNRYQESRKRAIEGRHKTEIRHKIRKFKEQMQRSLEHPTDRVYIPAKLAQAIIDICDLINTDTSLYKADGSLNMSQEKRNQTKERLLRLRVEYDNLKNDPDALLAQEYEEVISKYFEKLRTTYDGKSLMEMSLEELEEMYTILKSIDSTLKEARKTIGWADAQDIYEAGDAIVREQAEIEKSRKDGKRSAGQKAKDAIIDLTLSPVRNVERMTGYKKNSFLTKLFHEFERGVRAKNLFVMRAYKLFEALTQDKNYDDAIYKVYGNAYTDSYGRQFNVSKMQMMQAILSHEREDANKMTHIENGGFTFADLELLNKGKLREAISEENSHRVEAAVALKMIFDFKAALANDKWAQAYMEASRKFFDGMAKDAVNDTYLALKHRIIARDKNYIPFETDKNFVVREISAQNDIQQTINSYGMLQETKKGASQPLIISGLNNIVDRHIEQVGSIQGLAIPIRNFNKIWNVRAVETGFGNDPTVKGAIEHNWGTGGTKLVTQAVQDLQGARPNEQSWAYRKVKSGYITAKFVMNLSVVLKQVGSLFTSTSILKWRNPVSMMGNLVYTMFNSKKIAEEVDKYTASVWMRRQGLSDSELHTLMTEAKKPGILKTLSKTPTVINPAKWITAMDSMVALSLWKYAKEDTAARTGLQGEELLKATAEFYDSVIENTQSMSDVLHRPEIQKRGDIISESLGMFKTDLYQNAGQLQAVLGRYKANKTKENGAALARTVYGITASTIWGSLLVTSLIAMARYKVNPYRDDDDEDITFEAWMKRLGFGFVGELIGYIFPLAGGEFVDIVESIMYGESTDDAVDSLVLTAVNDLISTLTSIAASLTEGEAPSAKDWEKLLTKSLEIFGVPANNITRTINAIKLHTQDIANGEFLSFEAGAERTAAHHVHRISEALESGKTDVAEGLFNDAVETISDDRNEALSKLKSALGKKYKEGEISKDTVVEMLERFFDMTENDIYWQFDKWEYAIENGTADGYSKYGDLIEALESGQNINAIINKYTSNGVEKKTLKSQVTAYFKPLYKAAYQSGNYTEMARIRKVLYSSGLYGSANDVVKTGQDWLKG